MGNRFAAAGTDEVVGVLALGQKREVERAAGPDQGQRYVDCPVGRLASGPIPVEAKDRLLRHFPQKLALIWRQGGPERRHGGLETRRSHSDNIDIAFDGDELRALMRGLSRMMVIVKDGAFMEERGLRRIQIFRLGIAGEGARAKGDDSTPGIADRKHDSIAKTIVGNRDVLAMDQKPGLDHRWPGYSRASEMVPQGIFFRQRVAQA